MVEVKTTYDTPVDLTFTPASLASSATLIAGTESTEVDNSTTDKYIDALVTGFITVGATTVAADTNIYIYVWGNHETIGTNNLDTLTGSDGDRTITNTGVRDSMLKLGAIINVSATTDNITHHIQPFSVAQLFGGVMPNFWGVWLVHDTVAALNATAGNHEITYTGITFTSA